MNLVRYQLELGGEVIARINAGERDFPWTYGRLVDSPAFERFRRFFTDEADWPDDDPELDALCSDVQSRGGFVLQDMSSGVAYQGVRLNHDGGNSVWFRHGDPMNSGTA